jgi:hypothetical protein
MSSEDLEARIGRLEREGRMWRAAAVVSMVLAAVGWVVPSVSAQTQTITADTIFAHQIYVVPGPLAAGPTGCGSACTYVTLTADGNGASVIVSGARASMGAYYLGSAGPTAALSADAQSATVVAGDASHASEMGFAPNKPGAFRVYDPTSSTEPVWTAP